MKTSWDIKVKIIADITMWLPVITLAAYCGMITKTWVPLTLFTLGYIVSWVPIWKKLIKTK